MRNKEVKQELQLFSDAQYQRQASMKEWNEPINECRDKTSEAMRKFYQDQDELFKQQRDKKYQLLLENLQNERKQRMEVRNRRQKELERRFLEATNQMKKDIGLHDKDEKKKPKTVTQYNKDILPK
uniref:Uncharacterized protein n=1 Tax=Euplotes harpa TaxID=151035 RepID=A0A7S3NF05_9SPIT|mmetsp:Transcript_450/g.458  ORF Transcript_450/g.458 Transcript_450/m.458 type:complete len:126 (+) Transcript_450:105-482(+)